MAVSLAMAALSTGTLAAGAALTGTAAAYIGGTMLSHFLITSAMGIALNALSPKPENKSKSNSNRGYSLTGETGAALDHQIVYGETKVGGVRVYDSVTGQDNAYLHRILVFAGHEIDSYQKIYVDNKEVTIDGSGNVTAPAEFVGYVRIKRYYGTTTQLADPDLITDTATLTSSTGQWTTNHTLSELAYLYIRFTYNPGSFPTGIPVVNALIRGKKLYDPRTTNTTWSKNPALCIRDYMISGYGLEQTTSTINDTYYNAAANVCDQTVDGETRYTCSGAFITADTPKNIISNLITSMGGLFWNSEGTWKVSAAAYNTPTVTLNEDDLRSGINVSTRNSRRDNFNTVKGTFIGPETSWQEADYPSITDTAFLEEDNEVVNTVDLILPFTKTAKTAQRIAKIFLFRNREQITVSATFGLKALNLQVGDNVNLSISRFGWSSKVFEVTDWSFYLTDTYEVVINMTLRETSSNVFADVPGSTLLLNNTSLPDPYSAVDVGLTLSSSVRVTKETTVNVLSCNITSASPNSVQQVELQYKDSTSSSYINIGYLPLGKYDINSLDDGSYDVRVRSYSYFGVIGPWVSVSAYVINNTLLTISDVSNFYGELNASMLTLEWDAVNNPDLSYYKIRHTVDETGSANWSDSVSIVSKVSRPATSVSIPVKPGTYLIKAYNKSGVNSINAATFVVPASTLETFTTNTTQNPSPLFVGTKVNTSVTASTLRITDSTTNVPSAGTYQFPNYIDTGAVRRFRARIDMIVTRIDNSSGNFDDLTGNFDTLEGNFDTFGTSTSAQPNIEVITLISTTQTDPAGSPVWTAFQPFTNGQFVARAARFKIALASNAYNITPAVGNITATVQY